MARSDMEVGDVFTLTRTYTLEDIDRFNQLSGDRGDRLHSLFGDRGDQRTQRDGDRRVQRDGDRRTQRDGDRRTQRDGDLRTQHGGDRRTPLSGDRGDRRTQLGGDQRTQHGGGRLVQPPVDRDHHEVEPDAGDRTMVHGLFVAMVPSQLGGELDYVAREMSFELIRPVFAGDTVTCQLHITSVEPREHHTRIIAKAVCTNQRGEEVMRGTTRGQVPKQ